MKKAVAFLIPFMEREKEEAAKENPAARVESNAGVVVIATVKGDVHDIGKNIVAVVLGCNNYKVIDLGVMCSWENIQQAVQEHKADILGLSGLITPSLDEMVFNAKQMEKLGMKVPLLVGGATTSKMHTAVKIARCYSGPVVHVLDASRSVTVCQQLLDAHTKQEFVDDVREEYDEMRDEYLAGLEERNYKTLEQARARGPKIDWSLIKPVRPNVMGVKVFEDVDLQSLVPFIDWNPFFSVWQLRGKYPNRGYPKIFKDKTVGEEAQKLFNDAQAMLQQIVAGKKLQAKAVIGLYAANSVGDDIELYDDEARTSVKATLFTLRQQVEDDVSDTFVAMSDYVAPKSSGVHDYVGMFACSAGFGLEHMEAEYMANNDDYSKIMAQALADRLAEALAEKLHHDVRREHWGYAPDEQLDMEDMLKIKYAGIRPAPGYPSQPDHTEKQTMWKLMTPDSSVGIQLTESLAMLPAASVSGLYLANSCSSYFSLGKICKDQVESYAARKQMTVPEVERWLMSTLAYDV
jgi:5-methyltetrahydrofolate--homocysteine methyltransferase